MSDLTIRRGRTQGAATEKEASKKMLSLQIADIFDRIGLEDRAICMRWCGQHLEFTTTESGRRILTAAFFCKERLCPMCNWRRSLKVYGQVSEVMNEAERRKPTFRYLFLTLTVENVSGPRLKQTLDELQAGWKRLTERDEFRRAVRGWFRALEITYNRHRDDYHPHYHVILCVPTTYITGASYIKQARWAELWQEAMRLPYLPIVDIRTVKPKGEEDQATYAAAIAEVAKYTVKHTDFLQNMDTESQDSVMETLFYALFQRRLIAFGGLFNQIRKDLKMNDPIDVDLTDRDKLRGEIAVAIERYSWGIGFGGVVGYGLDEKKPAKKSRKGEKSDAR